MDKAKEISALYKDIKQQMGRLVSLCHEIESNAEVTADAYQRGYKEAYDTAYADAEEIYESGKRAMYQKGLKDAWEAARKICLEEDDGGIPASAINDIFNVRNYRYAVKDYSASECIEKIRQYQEKKEFHVGDEFEIETGQKFVIIKMDGNKIDRYIDENGTSYCLYYKYNTMRKTGRHFPEIAEVLQKMKENNDNK